MTKLLISVRDEHEALVALDGGAQVLDIKEPRRGSLGRAQSAVLERVVATFARRVPISAAGGELLELADPVPVDVKPTLSLPQGLHFYKLGLAGCAEYPDWRSRWRRALALLPAGTRPVAVAYADWKGARAPEPLEVLEVAAEFGCAGLLVDTCNKGQGGLLTHMATGQLAELIVQTRRAAKFIALAGSLRLEELPLVASLCPDIVALRGAVCEGGREGRLARRLVEKARAQLPRRPAEAVTS